MGSKCVTIYPKNLGTVVDNLFQLMHTKLLANITSNVVKIFSQLRTIVLDAFRIPNPNGDTRFGQSIILTLCVCAHPWKVSANLPPEIVPSDDHILREVQVSPVAFVYQLLCNKSTSVTVILIHYLHPLCRSFHLKVVILFFHPVVSITWTLLLTAI